MSDSKVPDDLRYTTDHEWARTEDDGTIVVGVTDFAQDALGDVTYLELPDAGSAVEIGGAFGVVESVKTFSDLYSPVEGEVVAVNDELVDAPEGINTDAYGAWLVKIKIADPGSLESLMDADAYRALLADQE